MNRKKITGYGIVFTYDNIKPEWVNVAEVVNMLKYYTERNFQDYKKKNINKPHFASKNWDRVLENELKYFNEVTTLDELTEAWAKHHVTQDVIVNWKTVLSSIFCGYARTEYMIRLQESVGENSERLVVGCLFNPNRYPWELLPEEKNLTPKRLNEIFTEMLGKIYPADKVKYIKIGYQEFDDSIVA